MSDDRPVPPDPGVDTTMEASRGSRDPSERHEVAAAAAAGNYELGRVIATGGMGRIHAARDRRLDRPVAIKQLLVQSRETRLRFEREIALSARLQHPSIVNILEAGQWSNGPFYAMKLVSGRPLVEVIREKATLDERLALLPVVIATADALAYAHDQRIIHRDLKPHNVLVGDFGETVVIDWGLAKDLAVQEQDLPATGPYRSEVDDPDGTRAGVVMGTPAYMPPEQARGEAVDERADVYALGAVLYHVLAGSPPHKKASSAEILKAVLAGTYEPLDRRQPGVPADLVTIVSKAMAADPAARYSSATGFADDLKRFQTGQLVSAHAYSAVELARRFVRRHRTVLLVAAALLAALIGVAVVSVRNILRAERVAKEQRDHAQERSRELMIQKARALLDKDPTRALASLVPYLQAGGQPRAARIVAADAWTRGVSRRVLRGHDSNVAWCAFFDDGGIASASYDGTLRVWGPDGSSRVLGHPGEYEGWRSHAPDGRAVASRAASGDRQTVWDARTGVAHDIPIDPDCWYLEFTTDSHWYVATPPDRRLRVWSLDGAPEKTIDGPPPEWINVGMLVGKPSDDVLLGSARGLELLSAATGQRVHITDVVSSTAVLDRDGARIALLDGQGVVHVYSRAGTELFALHGHLGAFGPQLAFTADGRYLVTSAQEEALTRVEVYVWDLTRGTGKLLYKSIDTVTLLTPLPEGHRVGISDSTGGIHIWDVERATSRALVGHESFVFWLAVSRDGRRIASSSLDATIRVWELADLAPSRVFIDDPERWEDAFQTSTRAVFDRSALTHDGRVLYAASGERKLMAWDLVGGQHRPFGETPQSIERVVLSHDERHVATLGHEPVVRVFDVAGGAPRALEGAAQEIIRLAWSSRDVLASGEKGGAVRLWDVARGSSRLLVGHTGDIAQLAFSPDGATLASSDDGGTIQLWDVASGVPRATLSGRARGASALAWTPDGGQLAVAGEGGTIQVWTLRASSTPVLRERVGHKRSVRDLVWSPDGRTLASASSDHTVRLWREDGRVQVLNGHTSVVSTVSWAPDGQRLASASSDFTVRLWDVPTGTGRPVPHDAPTGRVAFLADGVHVVSWSQHDVQTWTDDLPYDTAGLLAWIASHLDAGARVGAED
jgi:WD40 repeat protein